MVSIPTLRRTYISVSGAGDLRGEAIGGVITEVKYFFFHVSRDIT